MFGDRTNRPLWLRFTVSVLVAAVAAAIRLQFFEILELRSPFLTFYPAVAVAALYGGLEAGLLATVVSAALAIYFWMEPVGRFAITNSADLLSMVVFLASCTLISYLAETTYRAQARAHKAEEQSKLAAEREKAAGDLQQSEEHYRSLFDNMLNGYAYCRMLFKNDQPEDFVYLNVNNAFENLTGLKNVIGKKVSEVIPGIRQSDPDLFGIYGRVARTGVPERFETYVEALGMWFSISVYSPRKEHFVAVFDVITEQKEAERSLKESEERFRVMANSIPQLAWIAEADGYIVWYNQRWYDYTGTTPAQMQGWGWQSVHNSETLPGVLERWKNSIATGKPFDMVFPLRGADGSFREFLTRVMPVKNANGDVIQWCGTNTDITERKQMEEALRSSERLYRAIGESIDYGVWVCAPDGRNTYASESFLKLVGITQQECSDFGWGDVLHPEDAERTIAAWQECVRTGGIWDIEHRFLGVDGQWHPILARGVPVRNEAGEIVYWAGINLDISARKQMEEELLKSRDELELRVRERTAELNGYMAKLEKSNQALQDFASIASHDMKEPLRKVISFGNMLRQKSGESLGQSGNDYLNRMLNATERMQSLLGGLLDYSRVTTAAEPFKEVDLSDLIGEVLSDLEVRIVKTGGEVHVEDLPVISADHTQMRQLFQNLIGNALKFHKPGEKPIVQVRSISNTDSGCQIVVEDNGIGFEEKYLDRIFAAFQRLHGRSEYEGTGMGLAICKKIVERHGWSITAKSTPGEGSLFVIDLPARQAGSQELAVDSMK